MLLKIFTLLLSTSIIFWILSIIKTNGQYKYRAIGYFILGINGLVLLSPIIWIEYNSIIQLIASLIGSLISLYIWKSVLRKKILLDSVTRAILVSTIIYLLFYNITELKTLLIETTARDTVFLLNFIGYESEVVLKQGNTYINYIGTDILKTEIVAACTGIGTMSILAGVISTIKNIGIIKKTLLTSFVLSLIYLLNIIRNVFIASSYRGQHFDFGSKFVEIIFGQSGELTSHYIADKIISQPISALAIALIIIYILSISESDLLDESIEIFKNIREDISAQ